MIFDACYPPVTRPWLPDFHNISQYHIAVMLVMSSVFFSVLPVAMVAGCGKEGINRVTLHPAGYPGPLWASGGYSVLSPGVML